MAFMTIQEVLALFEYNEWANAKMLTVIDGIPVENLTTPIPSSFPSILGTMAHIVAAEWIWLRRWKGENPTSFPEWLSNPSLEGISAKLAEVESERRSLLASIDGPGLQRTIEYRTLNGTPYAHRLEDLCRHVVNHSTYHRGQLTTLLRHVGATPPATDMILFKPR